MNKSAVILTNCIAHLMLSCPFENKVLTSNSEVLDLFSNLHFRNYPVILGQHTILDGPVPETFDSNTKDHSSGGSQVSATLCCGTQSVILTLDREWIYWNVSSLSGS